MIYLEFILGFIVLIAILFAIAFRTKRAPKTQVKWEDLPKYMKHVAETKLDVKKIRGVEQAFWKQVISRTKRVTSMSTANIEKLNTTQQRSVYKIATGSSLPLPHVEYPSRTVEETLNIIQRAKENNVTPKVLVRHLSK